MGEQLVIQFNSVEQKEIFMGWLQSKGFNALLQDYPNEFQAITESEIGERSGDLEATNTNGFIEIE